ncbi:MAG TPA: NAD(P)/FAD-dependent oxidoreductase, partial [Gammaproteobacteria bacterium]|nr:NAD(P)/FAD-dependent oxidoreductase [Gammaproteobacteria bacterium]
MAKRYRLVVIGTGTAATTTATRVRAAGWSVAIVDFRPFGGTCALRGCDPKKLLVSGAAAVQGARGMSGKGIEGRVEIDWPELIAFKRGFTDPIPPARERRLADAGIDTYHGRARFTGTRSLAIEDQTLEADYILIAAGAEPVKLGIPGEQHLITNEQFLELETLPPRIALVGGGYIAAEFSHIAARAGARVTILQRGERMLAHFDPDLVGWLMEKFREIGIDVRTRATVESIEKLDGSYRVRAAQADLEQRRRGTGSDDRERPQGRKGSGKGQDDEKQHEMLVETDLVVHAAGRVPALDELDLAAAGIAHDKGRLELNDFLQSVSNPAVYAAGDAAGKGPPLTPVSEHDAEIVAANLLEGNRRKPDYNAVPSVAFTIPAIASVGLSQAEAERRGLRVRINCKKASDWFTARQAAEPTYGYKVLIEEQTDRILGAHLVGPHAEEVINLFALA